MKEEQNTWKVEGVSSLSERMSSTTPLTILRIKGILTLVILLAHL